MNLKVQNRFPITLRQPLQCLNETTADAVFQLLTSIPNRKATDLDQILINILKHATPIISELLCDLFNFSIQTAVFPEEWKLARVTPIHKGEAKYDVNKYRPISILGTVCKVFERIVYYKLYKCLNENNL